VTIIVRPKPTDRHKPEFFTERMLHWPDDAVSAVRWLPGDPWQFTFKADILRRKRERMEEALHFKRDFGRIGRRALFVWVFWCPGLGGFAFRGWWTYLIGLGGARYSAGGVKGGVGGQNLCRVMELFPVANPYPLLGPVDPYDWMPLFARKYQRGRWCGKPQGKAAVWATIQGEAVLEILPTRTHAALAETETTT